MLRELEPVLCEHCDRREFAQILLDEDKDFCEYAGYIKGINSWKCCEFFKEREYECV